MKRQGIPFCRIAGMALLLNAVLLHLPGHAGVPAADRTDPATCRIELLDLRDAALEDAVRFLSEESGYNIVTTQEARKTRVTIFLQHTTLLDALEQICKCYSLWHMDDPDQGVIRIMTVSEYTKTLVVSPEKKTKVFTLLYPNAYLVGRSIRDLFGKRVVFTQDWNRIYQERYELEGRLNRLDLLEQRGQFNTRGGRYGTGAYTTGYGGYGGYGGYQGYGGGFGYGGLGGYGTAYGYGSMGNREQGPEARPVETQTRIQQKETQQLTVEDTAAVERMKQISEILRSGEALSEEVRKSLMEEASSLTRTLTSKEAPIYVTVVQPNNQVVVRTADEKALDEIEDLVRRMDVPTPQVLLEVRVLSVDLGDDYQSVFDLSYSTKDPGEANPKNLFVGGDDPSSAGTLVNGSGGLLYQFLDSKLKFRLQLFQDEGRVTTMASPLILAANNEASKFFLGEERPIVRDVETQTIQSVQGNTLVTVNPVTETRNVGTTLLITPNINSDRTVSLRILQEKSRISENGALIPVSTGEGDIQNFEVDVVNTQNVIGTVVAKDDLTIAVGGLIEEQIVSRDSGIPWLKDLPILGMLFGNIQQTRTRTELVVLIRPFVVMTPEEAEKVSKERLEALSIHPYRYGKKDSLGTFEPEEVPGLVKPGPSWARALKLHQLGIMDLEDPYRFFQSPPAEPPLPESEEEPGVESVEETETPPAGISEKEANEAGSTIVVEDPPGKAEKKREPHE